MSRPAGSTNPLPSRSTGRPVALSGLARLLMTMQQRPALRLVPTTHAHDEPAKRHPVPAQLEGQV